MKKTWKTLLCLIVLCGAMLVSQTPREGASPPAPYLSYAPYALEEDAVRKGQRMGLGEASMEGPAEVEAGSVADFTLRFTVGKAGMKPGGGIRLATAHGLGTDWGGNHLQTKDPEGENFLAFRTSTGAPLQWKPYQGVLQNPLFQRYHPWQNINEFKLAGPALKPRDWVEVRISRVRMQNYDETAFVLKFYIDALGDDDYLPLARNPQVRILAAEAAELHVIVPSVWVAGKPGWMNVWAGDRYGNPATSFRGTLEFERDEGGAPLPAEYTFQQEDRGAHRFTNLVFPNTGTFRVRAREKRGKLATESNPLLVVAAAPRESLYWGDIHTHTMYSDGRGTVDETYDFGKRISALDFCSVTDHSFLVTDAMWREIKQVTNRYNQAGRYVTFAAYEWSGLTEVGGDHNVYTTDSDPPLFRCYSYFNYRNLRMYHGPNKGANHVEDLFRLLWPRYRHENILVIPHFGGRQANPAWHNAVLQRQIEIFSDHRRSEDWATKFLEKGYRVGIMASTDNHAGNAGYGVRPNPVVRGEEGEVFSRTSPAEKGTSLVAVYAKDLSREGVFQALYHRHTYATTGTRIILRFDLDGMPMGSEVRISRPPRIVASAEGTAEVQSMRLVKNGRVIHSIQPHARSARLEFQDSSGDYDRKFYYIDLVQTDGKKAISSPIWTN